MMPSIAAVGSNSLIANEIQLLVKNMLGNELSVSGFCIDEIKVPPFFDFYVCAPSQYKKLCKIVTAERVFVFELIPTSKFFLEIARIPSHCIVYIFNNLLPYTKTLSSYCRSLGIDKIKFKPIAYESMPFSKVAANLKKAEYIIGVDRFLGADALFSSRYKKYLKKDVHIIAGKRTASVYSSCAFLHALSLFFYGQAQKNYEKLLHQNKITADNVSSMKALAVKIDNIMSIIRTASVQIVANQIDLSAKKAQSHMPLGNYKNNDMDFEFLTRTVEKLLLTFAILNKKLEHLCH